MGDFFLLFIGCVAIGMSLGDELGYVDSFGLAIGIGLIVFVLKEKFQ